MRRWISILLAFALLLGSVPMTAFAQESPEAVSLHEETFETMAAEASVSETVPETENPETAETENSISETMPDSSETVSESVEADTEMDVQSAVEEAAESTAGDVALDKTNFPDANFRAYLAQFDADSDGIFTQDELDKVTSISICSASIVTLEGIQYFKNLKWLYCYDNQLAALDISTNTALAGLWCDNNQLTALDVRANTALTKLDCSYNQLTTLDISNNANLKYLYCERNQLMTLNVSVHTALLELDCADNQLTTLDVQANTALYYLGCWDNYLTSLDVSANAVLDYMDGSNNTYSIRPAEDRTFDLTTLPGNFDVSKARNWVGGSVEGTILTVEEGGSSATYTYDCGNGFSETFTLTFEAIEEDGSEIAIDETNFPDEIFRSYVSEEIDADGNGSLSRKEIGDVIHIDVNNAGITSLKGVEFFANLKSLECSGNKLTELDVSQNTVLTQLYCSWNQLTEVDVRNNTALTWLSFYNNQLTALDISQNTALTYLSCSWNQLTALDVSQNTALKDLDCCNNQLTELDVSQNTALTNLDCSGNQLAELDVSQNTALTDLDCGGNQLTDLDVSKHTALAYLECGVNQLRELDVSNNIALMRLVCPANKLAELDISKNAALCWLDCTENQLTSLNASNNIALTLLYCGENQLTELDVSQNTELIDLFCYDNQLTSLDVSTNTALVELSCGKNRLTSLDISNCPDLEELYCADNQFEITMSADGTFDLSTLPGFDVTRADNWKKASVSGTVLSVNGGADTVTYAYNCGNGMHASFTLAILNPFTAPTSVTIYIDGEEADKTLAVALNEGITFRLDARVAPSTAKQQVLWFCKPASVATVDDDGLLTFLKPGTVTVAAKAADNTQKTDSIEITGTYHVEDVTITAPTDQLDSGKSLQLTAAVAPEEAANKKVTWSVDDTSAATVSSSGKLTAKTVYVPTTVTVTAASQEDPTIYDTFAVTISSTQLGIYVDGTNQTGKTIPCDQGDTFSLDAITNGLPEDVTWKLPKSGVELDEAGIVSFTKTGTFAVTATASDKRNAKVTFKVTAMVKGLEVSSKNGLSEVASGKSLALKVSFTPENPTNKKVTWEILSGEEYAKISSSGVVTAVKGLESEQQVLIQATAMDGSGESDTFEITVFPVVTKVEIGDAPARVDMTLMPKLQLTANTAPDGASGAVTWKSSSRKVATVDANGEVTFLKPGTVTITATAADGSGRKDTHKITVTKSMGTLELPETAIVAAKMSLKMTKLEGYAIDAMASNKKLTWTLTDENGGKLSSSVATISSAGVLKAKAIKDGKPVTLTVHAAAKDDSGLAASCTVTVYPAAIKKMELRDEDGKKLARTVEVSLNGSMKLCPVVTSPADMAQTALGDESLSMEALWSVTASKAGWVRASFENDAIVLTPGEKAEAGGTVKVTVKAMDGSNKSASVTIRFS